MAGVEIAPDYPVIEEREDEYRVHIDVMGAEPEDVCIDVRKDQVEIFASAHQDVATEEAFRHMEGQVYHSIPVPKDADVTGLECSYTGRHLDLILPKA